MGNCWLKAGCDPQDSRFAKKAKILQIDIDPAEINKNVLVSGSVIGDVKSVLDILNTFQRVNNIDLGYTIGPRRPGDAATTYADPSLAEKELGWKAEKTLDEMCRDAWNFRKLREAEK